MSGRASSVFAACLPDFLSAGTVLMNSVTAGKLQPGDSLSLMFQAAVGMSEAITLTKALHKNFTVNSEPLLSLGKMRFRPIPAVNRFSDCFVVGCRVSHPTAH